MINYNPVCRTSPLPSYTNLFINQANLVPVGFLTAQFLQKLCMYEAFVVRVGLLSIACLEERKSKEKIGSITCPYYYVYVSEKKKKKKASKA